MKRKITSSMGSRKKSSSTNSQTIQRRGEGEGGEGLVIKGKKTFVEFF